MITTLYAWNDHSVHSRSSSQTSPWVLHPQPKPKVFPWTLPLKLHVHVTWPMIHHCLWAWNKRFKSEMGMIRKGNRYGEMMRSMRMRYIRERRIRLLEEWVQIWGLAGRDDSLADCEYLNDSRYQSWSKVISVWLMKWRMKLDLVKTSAHWIWYVTCHHNLDLTNHADSLTDFSLYLLWINREVTSSSTVPKKSWSHKNVWLLISYTCFLKHNLQLSRMLRKWPVWWKEEGWVRWVRWLSNCFMGIRIRG